MSSERKASKRHKNDIIDLSEEKSVKALKIFKKAVSVILCLSLSGALFTGCKKSDDLFPSIISESEDSEPSDEPDQTSGIDEGNEICQLEVALPYSDLTIQYLAAMLYCKNNGLWDSSETGLTISTDYLSSVASNYVITNIGCGSTGVNLDTVKGWKASGTEPDLFLAQDSAGIYKAGYAETLNEHLADSKYLTAQQVYSGAMTADSEDGIFFAVPHFCSAKIVMGNTEYIPSGIGKLQTKNTTENLKTYLEAIKKEHRGVAGFASAYELIPYLGSAFNKDVPTSYMVSDEYTMDKIAAGKVIKDAASYVKSLYSDSLAQDQIDGADPIYSRKAALWVDSSANIRAWADYYPGSLYLLHLPCNDATNVGVPYISTYSLCVSKDSGSKDFASEFAAFISFDTDAQLLIYRLEDMTGLMPLTRNDAVWELISSNKIFGHMAADFHQIMDNAVYCPDSFDSKVFSKTNEYTAEYVKQNDEFDPEKCYG